MDSAVLPGDGGLGDRVPFLARLEAEDASALRGLGRPITFAARSPLMQQHEPSTHVLLILTGWTKVTVAGAGGYHALLALRGPGDIVGESAGVTGRPRSATVTALEPVQAVAIDQHGFHTFLAHRPRVALTLLGLTADRIRAADQRQLEFASMSVRERLAALLIDLSRTHGRRTEDGVEITVPLTKQELAGAVGASREMVQRQLRELRARGVVSTGRRALVIVRPDVLHRIGRPHA
ncbi:Crp/Fnr family transcriptional regulator [Streptomyces antimicrobicus]|uniref:Crp/Fnr family transcriptional regulator n=1 Tax=Streptomyces antimicrobicus TaxID=2883108 RepID=A0ABS8B214_9ACTN|nr:Crp/Fnr family transcriptional regulator [Streptomyces antimicrobicus]MCB5178649.1 Crp/Fnr family transcriptional regulator [Streptomyces antimicrobicus]